jgi:hypothetical protein
VASKQSLKSGGGTPIAADSNVLAVLARALIDRREKLKEEDAEKHGHGGVPHNNSRPSLHMSGADDWA